MPEKNGENEEKNKKLHSSRKIFMALWSVNSMLVILMKAKFLLNSKMEFLKVVVPEENTTKSDRVIEIK